MNSSGQGRSGSSRRSNTQRLAVGAAGLLALILLCFSVRADAALVHPFKELFGAAAQPSFTNAEAVAVDQSSGDVLVVDVGAQTLSRFKPSGEPDPFPALGTHVIDARKGPENKICAEEPASCDAPTPPAAEGFLFGEPSTVQVAVDDSGPASPTDGNIYVTQVSRKVVSIYAADGHYLGQLTAYQGPNNEVQKFKQPTVPFYLEIEGFEATATIPSEPKQTGAVVCNTYLNPKLAAVVPPGPNCTGAGLAGAAEKTITFNGGLANTNVPTMKVRKASDNTLIEEANTTVQGGLGPVAFQEVPGVAVDASGSVYVSEISIPGRIHKFVPAANPPVNGDYLTSFILPSGQTPRGLAMGAASTAGRLFVALNVGSVLSIDASSGAIQPTAVSPGPATTIGTDPSSGNLLLSIADVVKEYDASGTGEGTELSTLNADSPVRGLAVNGSSGGIYISRASHPNLDVFGPSIRTATVTTSAASAITATDATLNGTVNSEGTPLVDCVFEYGKTAAYGFTVPCAGAVPNDGKAHPVTAALSGLDPEETYHFRIVATNGAAPEVSTPADRTFATGSAVITKAASSVADTGAVLNGTVNPVGQPLTECKFEYGLTPSYGSSVSCDPSAGSIEPDFKDHPVSAELNGLAKNATYHFRLVAANAGGVVAGEDLTFTTVGPPLITDVVPLEVTQTSAVLQAKVDPRGAATSYRFEWGPTAAYGHTIPADFDGSAGDGTAPVTISARVADLQVAGQYHFRVVARNASGVANGPDQPFETLNRCFLTQNRCFEMVSPADKGPTASPGKISNGEDLMFQVDPAGGALAYQAENGFSSSTAGEGTVYVARRGEGGWESRQLSPPWSTYSQLRGFAGTDGRIKALASNLSCGVVTSASPLTPDAPLAVAEGGGTNLFRRDSATGEYRVITGLTPSNATTTTKAPVSAEEYLVLGMSQDCERVVFRSYYHYPGLSRPGSGQELYEWDRGTIRNLGVIPGPGGAGEPVRTEVVPGATSNSGGVGGEISGASMNYWRAVSADLSRVVFSAVSQFGGDAGNAAVFLREGEGPALDVSQSETATANNGKSRYQGASRDGGRIFFTARYGLAGNGSSAGSSSCSNSGLSADGTGCDLYEYDAAKPVGSRLTDLSVDTTDPKGAGVVGVLATSDDGTHVYFAARGQLVPGEGRTGSANEAADAFNVYLRRGGETRYVGTVLESEATGDGGTLTRTEFSRRWTSQATPDGRHLLFETAARTPGGASMAYLYSDEPTPTTVCLSCRQDGGQPRAHPGFTPLLSMALTNPQGLPVKPVSLTANGQRAFFYSRDALAYGAVSGSRNLFEWSNGQVSLIATEPSGVGGALEEGTNGADPPSKLFAGASLDGGDVYFVTPRKLTSEDLDERWDIYDARVGGGYPPRAQVSVCDPLSEGSCQGQSAPSQSGTAPATTAANLPGNPAPKEAAKKKTKKKKSAKKKHRKKQQGKRGKRRANTDRGVGK